MHHAFELYASKLDLEKIITYSLRLDAAVAKRLGWVLDNLKTDEAFLQRLEEVPVKRATVLLILVGFAGPSITGNG